MSTNLVETVQSRLDLMGMSQAQLADNSSATPSQMGIFLRGKGSLSTESLNKVLDILGVDLSIYVKRNNLAKEVALFLKSRHVESIDNWPKEDLALFTRKKEVLQFFDVNSREELLSLIESDVVDVESSYPYFKALIQYYMSIEDSNPTASQAKQAIENLTKNIINSDSIETDSNIKAMVAGAAVGILAASPLIAGGVGILVGTMLSKQVGAISLFSKSFGKSLFTKALSYFAKD